MDRQAVHPHTCTPTHSPLRFGAWIDLFGACQKILRRSYKQNHLKLAAITHKRTAPTSERLGCTSAIPVLLLVSLTNGCGKLSIKIKSHLGSQMRRTQSSSEAQTTDPGSTRNGLIHTLGLVCAIHQTDIVITASASKNFNMIN